MESERPRFRNAEYYSSFTLEELGNANRETQKEVMRNWFFDNYEDPVERTPYESREGGYIYIWGGPYKADWEISGVFEGYIPDDVIQELVDELEYYCSDWTSAPRDDDYDDYYSSVLLSNPEFHKDLVESLERVNTLLDVEVVEQLRQHYLRLLYINVITALESFLSDGFINTVMSDPALVRKFVETNPDFARKKFALSELFEQADVIEDKVKRYLSSLMWHNLEKIKPMYKETLDIEFPKDLAHLFRAILMRHDLVHRNGKTKDGGEILLNRNDVSDLIEQVRTFGEHVDGQFGSNLPDDLGF